MVRHQRFLIAALGVSLAAVSVSQAALSIDLKFDNFGTEARWDHLYNDAWNASTTAAEKQAAAQNVIRTAANYWEAAFANSTKKVEQTINVVWGPRSGSTLATGGTGWNPVTGAISNGILTWNNRDEDPVNFFVDLTPTSNEEWSKSSMRMANLGGVEVNVENTYYNANTSSTTFMYSDMLSIAIHEIGHALGFLNGYFPYDDLGHNGYLELDNGSEIGYSGGHHGFMIDTLKGYPADGWSGGPTFYSTVMGPSIMQGTRKLLTDADIWTMASIHGFDNPVLNFPIPEPATLSLLAVGTLTLLRRRST